MNYYSFNINDYLSDTAHLEPMEDLAYRRLLDLYYQTEMPLPDDIATLAKRIRLRGQEEAIVAVLNEFFIHYGDSYRHTRCDAELGELYQKSAKAKASAQARWAKEKAKKQGQAQTNSAAEPEIRQPENAAAEPNFNRFAMHPNWQPDDVDTVNALLHRAKLPSWGTGLISDAALDFVAYWRKRPDVLNTAGEWDNDFVRSVVKFRAKHGHDYDTTTWELKQYTAPNSTAVSMQTATPHAPSKTKQSAVILSAVREKVVSGSLKTVLPPKICLAMIDGLLGLLGQGLNCPPAADVWELTLTNWANEFAARSLGDDDVANVQAAFQAAKRKATHPDNPEKRFPNAADVLACLPMKLVQKQLGHKLSPEEWAEKAANGRAKTAELMKNIGKSPIQAA